MPATVLRAYEEMQETGDLPSSGDGNQVFRRVTLEPTSVQVGADTDVAVAVELELDGPHPDGYVLVIIADEDHRVIGSCSSKGHVRFDEPGRVAVRCAIGPLPLREGDYLVHVCFLGDEAVPAVDEMRSLPLRVEGPEHDRNRGPLLLEPEWALTDPA